MNEKFLVCKSCHGKTKICSTCKGIGVGIFFQKYFIFFRSNLDNVKITINRIKRKLDDLMILSGIFCGVGGILSLMLWLYTIDFVSITDLFFWNKKHYLILLFWLGIIGFGFSFYKKRNQSRRKNRIKKLLNIEDNDLPDNWDEIKYYNKKYNVVKTLSTDVEIIIENSYLLAKKFNHKEISSLHLFNELLKNKVIMSIFIRLGIDFGDLVKKVHNQLSKQGKLEDNNFVFSVELDEIIILSFIKAYSTSQKDIDVINIFKQCFKNSKIIQELIFDSGIDLEKVENTIEWFKINKKISKNLELFKKVALFKPKTRMDRAYTAIATPLLNMISYDLTLAAKWGRLDICVARNDEINKIFEILLSGKKGVILLGSNGVGKKTIINEIARLMVKEKVPKIFKDKRLIELDIARLISGTTGSIIVKRLISILDEVTMAKNIVLCIKNIDILGKIKSNEEDGVSLLQIFAGILERQEIYCIASATNENYSNYIENTQVLSSMGIIQIKEPLSNKAIYMVESKIGRMEARFKNIFYSYSAIEEAVKLTSRFIHDKYLPQKAIDVLEKTGARLVNIAKNEKRIVVVDKNEVAVTINELTGIPIQQSSNKENKKLLNLEQKIHKYMINQKEAVNIVSNSIRRARVDLRNRNKTIANFLFLGPTGVGKTELAKTVSLVYFGNKKYMSRFDMSEYQHEDSVKKMIGAINGVKGSLTEAVRKKPFSLILLDEFEKAHPKILDLFLQVMGYGKLTDADGEVIDFTNTIIMATSNAGASYIKSAIHSGIDTEEIKRVLINKKLNSVMKPELLNRFDGIVVFKPLTMENIIDITKLMLNNIKKMLKEKGILMKIRKEGVLELAKEGYDPDFGARPLRRVLQKRIENEIAKKILDGSLKRRDTVIIDNTNKITIEKTNVF